jgi:hypothetical protein
VIGGREKNQYFRCNIEIVIDKMMKRLGHTHMIQKKAPIVFRYSKEVGFYDLIRRRDMQN